MNNKTIYLDNNATTQVAPEVFEAMKPFFCELYGNPSSIHSFGGQVSEHIENARREVAQLIGATFRDKENVATEIIFTSCGTESDNAALRAAIAVRPGRKRIVTTVVEHPAILSCCSQLEREGFEIVKLSVDGRGRLNMDEARAAINKDTAIVSVMWANNETGTIFPIAELSAIAHEAGALFHSDAVQAAGKVSIDVKRDGIDFLSISGHKLHASKGVGVLYVRRGIRFTPFIHGGHQEKMRRGGTENVTSIIGMGEAARLARLNLENEYARLKDMRDKFEAKLLASIPRIRINGDLDNRLPNTSSVSFECIEGEAILMYLDEQGICASSGSACTTGSLEPSHVLMSMGLPYIATHGTIRFSLSQYNTMEELDKTADALVPIIANLRSISPFWEEK